MKIVSLKTLSTIAAIGALTLPLAANAAVPGQTQMRGTITAFDGKYDVHVQDRKGNIDAVELHRGTIINPTGLTLHPGMHVTILGNRVGDTFAANEIDTPYHIEYVQPPLSYWGSGPYWGDGPYWGGRFWGGGLGGWF